MSVVDVLLLVLALVAVVVGFRLGALVLVMTIAGFWAGLVLGALLSSWAASWIGPAPVKAAFTIFAVLGTASILGLGGRLLGHWSVGVLRRFHLGSVDSLVGVGVALVALVFSAWLLGNLLSQSNYTWLSAQIQKSRILQAVDGSLPPVPTLFSRVQTFLGTAGFPPAFISPTLPTQAQLPVPSGTQAQSIALSVADSTYKVIGTACGGVQEGTGFVVAPGMVVTNAHVVAGEAVTDIVIDGTDYRATAVLFDPRFDLAVLRTRAPLGTPLQLDPSLVSGGTKAVVVGYPEDGALSVAPAAVVTNLEAEGRDIYNEGLVTRRVYELDARIEPGNSGSPLVTANGSVTGIVFSRSTAENDVGYALTSPGVLRRVRQAEQRTAATATGGCTQN